jgi:hypothetical protein
MTIDIKNIFEETFFTEVQERNKKQSLSAQREREISSGKKKMLAPIIQFLDMFVESKVYVRDKDYYSPMAIHKELEPVLFSYYLGDSSKLWSPGISIFIDHPGMEISIPNKIDDTVVNFHLYNHHPDKYIIEQQFPNMEKALKSLGTFLARCAVKIESPQNFFKKEDTQNVKNNIFNSKPINPQLNNLAKNVAKQNVDSLFSINKNTEKE